MSMVLAIVALGVLIIVHELGHFLAAKLCGVYVERFSVGFGPRLYSKTVRETEYCLSAIPLGGYVKLHRMTEDEEVVEGKESRAFFNKPYYKKIIVIVAGVFFNLIFAVFLFAVTFMAGYEAYSPVVGAVSAGKAADRAGFIPNDRILEINGKSVRSWEEFIVNVNKREGESTVTVDRSGSNRTLLLLPDKESRVNPFGENETFADVGMSIYVEPVVGGLSSDYPAEKAGIRKGDKFISINGEDMRVWQDVVGVVRSNPGSSLSIVVQRGDEEKRFDVTPTVVGEGEATIGMLGIVSPGGDLTLREAPWTAFWIGAEQTAGMVKLIYKGIWQLLSGKISKDNIGGPILIVKETANSVKDGFGRYLSFIALISINLAVLNLLPAPILDGGYVMVYTYERLSRRRVSSSARMVGRAIGIALLSALMVLAFYNDITRFFRIM